MNTGAARSALSRRAVLAGAVTGAGVATAATLAAGQARSAPPGPAFHGPHQAGIVSPALPYLSLAGFDVVARGRDSLVQLLRTWTSVAADLVAAPTPSGPPGGPPTRLSLTVGFGPSLFAADRFGIADRRPAALVPLPAFEGESLDRTASNGDLCVQACASTPAAAHQAVRTLLNAARTEVALRWRQTGFLPEDGTADPHGLFGFRDGTSNLDVHDPRETAEHLWVDEPGWLRGGTYLVMRRIRLLLDTWDRTDVATQEDTIGRRRDSNRRFPAPATAHAPLASPVANNGAKLLRRPYSYDAGVDPNGLMDAGLIFLCFQRDPRRQFVPIQRRLAAHDALNGFSQHLASGLFACPPGVRRGSWIGAELFS